MCPIFLQDGEHGIGLPYEEFKQRFEAICEEHLKEKRAKAFSFVFCDFGQGLTASALQGPHGFGILNEVSGNEMTVFYLHVQSYGLAVPFNRHFLKELGVEDQVKPPCIVCFREYKGAIDDVAFHVIDERSGDPVLVVEQVRRHVTRYLSEMKKQGDASALPGLSDLLTVSRLFRSLGAPL